MGNVGGKVTRNIHATKQVPSLESIIPEVRLIYTLKWKYGGYKITNPIEVNRSILTGTIKYIEKAEDAEGFGKFMDVLERDARTLKLRMIRVEFDQCSKSMQEKLKKHAAKKGFDCDEIATFDEGMADIDRVTGPNLQIYKEISRE